ncbi:hypothetical protein D3P08_12130 [Paenibacillus nanensis]|uniref:Uncharacterized protein n=1 Tax=Paenibacillus nanensis TaxID=393251 RepID=A0A3A1V2H3_9BACL|nr:hypothetical protein [Paenibacillus nanensis]RIX52753.1 hypothetical protein D3P08_12130 [Paenibacillus nanensis]
MSSNKLRRFLMKEDGAVTVFSVILLASLLLFFAVLIDYARIAAFQLKTENAARSGARSVLSAYDSWLFERYGLFGRGGTDGAAIFSEVMKANAGEKSFGAGESFGILESSIEETKLNTASTLGDHDVFARQVLEDMKYKAPIDFSLELVAKFTPLAGALRESSNAVHTLEQLRKLYEKREDLLEKALRLQEQAVDTFINSDVMGLIPAGRGTAGNSRDSAAALADRYVGYVNEIRYDAMRGADEELLYSDSIAQFEKAVANMTRDIRSGSGRLKQRHAQLLQDAALKLEEAVRVNDQMRLVLAQADAASGEGYGKVASAKTPGSTDYSMPSGASQELAEIKNSGEKLLRTSEWFAAYKSELVEQGNRGTVFTSELDQLLDRWNGAMTSLDPIAQGSLLASIVEIGTAVADYERLYSMPGTVLKERREVVLNSSLKEQLAAQEKKKASLWGEANRLLQGMSGVTPRPDHQEMFQRAKARYEQNLQFNRNADSAAQSGKIESPSDANEAAEQSASMMDGLFSGMSDMLLRSRDTFYYGEYAAKRFSYFEPQQLRMLLTNGDVEGVAQAASFYNQEMEYVLYGFHEPMGNIIAAYGELFSVRLAIRTMEGFMESRSLGHPLLILSAAIIYGLEKTMEDMLSFTEKGSAPLSKYVRVDLTYSDYLRLFMLLHGGAEENRLARMIAVIEQNTDLTLASVPVGVTGEVTASMKLWFLPGVMSMLGRLDLLQGKVVGNRYETTKTVGWSY